MQRTAALLATGLSFALATTSVRTVPRQADQGVGVVIEQVARGSAPALAGLRAGDVLLS